MALAAVHSRENHPNPPPPLCHAPHTFHVLYSRIWNAVLYSQYMAISPVILGAQKDSLTDITMLLDLCVYMSSRLRTVKTTS
jgi:hypothetical protein